MKRALLHAVIRNPVATRGDDHTAAIIWWCLGTIIVAFGALFILEGITYWFGKAQITDYIRNWSVGHWWLAIFIGVGLVAATSVALTHFVFDARQG
jgi:hypothetical protein